MLFVGGGVGLPLTVARFNDLLLKNRGSRGISVWPLRWGSLEASFCLVFMLLDGLL